MTVPITAIVNASGVSARLGDRSGEAASAATTSNPDPQRASGPASGSHGLRQFKVLQSRSVPAQLTLSLRR
jgi:hypothetical protein